MFDYHVLANPPQQQQQFNVGRVNEMDYRRQQENIESPSSVATGRRRRRRSRRKRSKREITLGYRPTHKLFLIPSLFLFFRITALVLMFCELALHIWAHRMNSRNKDATIFYRSPLHLITSQFCAKCLSQVGMAKLGLIQDKRREAKRLIALSRSVH